MNIVYTDNSPWGALFATRDVARRTAQIWRAVYESSTWGDFRTALPDSAWDEVVECLEGDEPDDDTPFTSGDAPGWEGDGCFLGPWPPEEVLEWFPDDLIQKYNGEIEVTPNGQNLLLPADAGDQIAEELRARGHEVEKTPTGDLADWLRYSYAGY